jgi:hypothetical protein
MAMKRSFMIALVTAGLGTTAAVTAGALLDVADPTPEHIRVVQVNPLQTTIVPQPDTNSPKWRFLSDDVGILLRDDGRLGLRAHLYVRIDNEWRPVVTDGPGDSGGALPAR